MLSEAEAHRWDVIVSRKGYWKLRCHCPEKHQRWVHLTPSNPHYARQLRHWLQTRSCW